MSPFARSNAGIVDDYIQSAKYLDGLLNQILHVFRLGHVGLHENGPLLEWNLYSVVLPCLRVRSLGYEDYAVWSAKNHSKRGHGGCETSFAAMSR